MKNRDDARGQVGAATELRPAIQESEGGHPHFVRQREVGRDTSDKPSTTPVYYPLFDWLRAFLAIVVVLVHLQLLPGEEAGHLAVQVFFALSGWLIGGMLVKMEPAEMAHFYFNRAFRIWVPYYLGLILLVSVSLLRDAVTWKWFEFVSYKVLFVYNLFGPPQLASHLSEMPLNGTGNHFWSVNAEEQFYLVAPLVLVYLPSRIGRHPITWTLLAATSWLLHTYFSSIIFGVFAAVIVNHFGDAPQRLPIRLALTLVSIVSLGGVMLGQDLNYWAPFGTASLVVLLALRGKPSPVGTIVGGMSYPLYLNHWAAIFVTHAFMDRLFPEQIVAGYVVAVVLSIAMAVVHYLLIDRPLRRHRQRWFNPQRGRGVMWFGYAMLAAGITAHFVVFAR